MPEANSMPSLSSQIGRNPAHGLGATPKPKLPDRLRESLHSGHSFATHLLEAGHDIRNTRNCWGTKPSARR